MVYKFRAAAVAGIAVIATLAGCQSPPPMPSVLPTGASQTEILNEAATAELGAQICQGYGGLRATDRLRDLADSDYAKARQMGATDADIRAAQIRARQQAEQDQVLLGNQGACNKLLSLAPVEIPAK